MNDDGAIELYAFRYRDSRTGKWVRARYKATPEEIAARYAEWEIIGPGEERRPAERCFNPVRREGGSSKPRRLHEPAPQRVLTDGEAWDLYAWDAPPGDLNGRHAAWARFGEPLEVANMRAAQPLQAIVAHLDLDEWCEVAD